jgi:hypothetical protein
MKMLFLPLQPTPTPRPLLLGGFDQTRVVSGVWVVTHGDQKGVAGARKTARLPVDDKRQLVASFGGGEKMKQIIMD